VEAAISPFRGLGLGLFFVTVGFSLDISFILSRWRLVFGVLGAMIIGKAAIITLLGRVIGGMDFAQSQQAGLLLSQSGEFAFVAAGLAQRLGLLHPLVSKAIMASTALSMLLTPVLERASSKITKEWEKTRADSIINLKDPELHDMAKKEKNLVVVVGYGRVGKTVCDVLDKKLVKYIAVDNDSEIATAARSEGRPVWYGDIRNPLLMSMLHVEKAKAVVLTLDDVQIVNRAVIELRKQYPDLAIFARAKDEGHRKRLQSILDVTSFIPTLHSEEFAGAVLLDLGIETAEVQTLVEDMRRRLYSRQLEGLDGGASIQEAREQLVQEHVRKEKVRREDERKKKEREARDKEAAGHGEGQEPPTPDQDEVFGYFTPTAADETEKGGPELIEPAAIVNDERRAAAAAKSNNEAAPSRHEQPKETGEEEVVKA